MRSKVTLVLLFLNVALFFFIFRYERNWRTESAATLVRHRVLGAEAADIRSLEVTGPNGAIQYSLERRGENWFLRQPIEWPANSNAVTKMIDDLQLLAPQTSFRVADLEKSGQSLADYGLDHPRMSIAFTSGGSEGGGTAPLRTVLRLGDATQVGNRLYLLSPDGSRIYVVERDLVDSFSLSIERIRSEALMTIPAFEASALTVQTGGPAGLRVALTRDGDRWSFETPILARASRDAVDLAINGLDSLTVKGFPGQSAPPTAPVDSPTLVVRVEGDNRSETLILGEPVAPGSSDYYAQFRDGNELRSAVFEVTVPEKGVLSGLRDAQEALREHRILDFDPNSVSAIALSAPNRPGITLQRLDGPGGGDASNWQIVSQGEGGGGPLAMSADTGAVQRLLEQLGQLSAEDFQSDSPQATDLENWGFNRPEREITLTLTPAQPSGSAPAPPSTLTLQIGQSSQRDGPAYAKLATGLSVFTVDPDILRQTNVGVLAWRDRRMRILPAGARVASLSIVDQSDGRDIYSRVLSPGETWETALASERPDRRKAVETVASALLALRARSFLDAKFGDRVNAGGEDRPWRYRIDATLAIPAGAHGEQTSPTRLLLTERMGGTEQIAGSPELGTVFEIEQPFLDALWTLTYSRDPGPLPPLTDAKGQNSPAGR